MAHTVNPDGAGASQRGGISFDRMIVVGAGIIAVVVIVVAGLLATPPSGDPEQVMIFAAP
jgi:hypothetical protein